MTADMLPMLTNFTPINSTAIQCNWQPSPSVMGINLYQLEGVFCDSVYVGNGLYSTTSVILDDMDKINETGQTIINTLSPDTVYYVCYESKWFQPNTTIVIFNFDGLYRRQCGLLRTYMADQTTLNPVPQFGQYSWKQQMANNGTLKIVINASISSKLPYAIRNITVTLGSQVQSQEFTIPSEFVEFEFDGLDSKTKTYSLVLNFSLISSQITTGVFTATNIVNGTVTTTAASSRGNRLFAWHFLFLVFFCGYI